MSVFEEKRTFADGPVAGTKTVAYVPDDGRRAPAPKRVKRQVDIIGISAQQAEKIAESVYERRERSAAWSTQNKSRAGKPQ